MKPTPLKGEMRPYAFDKKKKCSFHQGVEGHDEEGCWELRRKIQQLMSLGVLSVVDRKKEIEEICVVIRYSEGPTREVEKKANFYTTAHKIPSTPASPIQE